MGYTEIDRAFRTSEQKDEFLRGEVERRNTLKTRRVLKSAFVGRVWYAACEIAYPEKEPVVMAQVYPTASDAGRRSFSWRALDEGVNPFFYDCPTGIMSMLSPLDVLEASGIGTEWVKGANDWREGVRETARQKSLAGKERSQIKDGTVLVFANPLEFKGTPVKVREAIARREIYRGRKVFICEAKDNPGLRFRLKKSIIERAAIAPAANPDKAVAPTVALQQVMLPLPGLAA